MYIKYIMYIKIHKIMYRLQERTSQVLNIVLLSDFINRNQEVVVYV